MQLRLKERHVVVNPVLRADECGVWMVSLVLVVLHNPVSGPKLVVGI